MKELKYGVITGLVLKKLPANGLKMLLLMFNAIFRLKYVPADNFIGYMDISHRLSNTTNYKTYMDVWHSTLGMG